MGRTPPTGIEDKSRLLVEISKDLKRTVLSTTGRRSRDREVASQVRARKIEFGLVWGGHE
jgi:hypothetical protein